MNWIVLSLVSALSWALADLFAKRALERAPAVHVAWVRSAFSLPVLAAAVLLWGWSPPGPGFWPVVGAALPLEVVAALLYQKALQISPLGLTAPYLAFTPVFLVLTGWWILGEVPSALAGLGIGLVCAGGYLLHLEPGMSWAGPLRALGRERGSLIMLGVAGIYSLTAALGKKAVVLTDPQSFALIYYGLLTAALTPLAWRTGRPGPRVSDARLAAVGVFMAAMILAHFAAIRVAPASYMVALKRTSLLWSIAFGAAFLGESGGARRLLGGTLMVAGVFLIASSG